MDILLIGEKPLIMKINIVNGMITQHKQNKKFGVNSRKNVFGGSAGARGYAF